MTVIGSPLSVLGKVWLNFAIKSDVFPFEAYVIKNLTQGVVLGRDFHMFSKLTRDNLKWTSSTNIFSGVISHKQVEAEANGFSVFADKNMEGKEHRLQRSETC